MGSGWDGSILLFSSHWLTGKLLSQSEARPEDEVLPREQTPLNSLVVLRERL